MTFANDVIHKSVGRLFEPVDPAKVVRSATFRTVGSGLLIVAALRTDGWLSWLLWAWVAYRAFVMAIIVAIGTDLMKERERRLSALPRGCRDFLITGKPTTRMTNSGSWPTYNPGSETSAS